ncbi:unnamed protein product, partial [Meganyctiphanes norvegica]
QPVYHAQEATVVHSLLLGTILTIIMKLECCTLILFACVAVNEGFLGIGSFNKRTCFRHITLKGGVTATWDVPDRKIKDGFVHTSCRRAQRKCHEDFDQALKTALLGAKTIPFNYLIGDKLCNDKIRKEILPSNSIKFYGNQKVSNCGDNVEKYLGELCCWAYKAGRKTFYEANIDCKQTSKP